MRSTRAAGRSPEQPREPTLAGVLGMVAVLVGVVSLIANPLATAAALVVGAAVWLAATRFRSRVTRLYDETRELTVPGLGTVEYRLTDR